MIILPAVDIMGGKPVRLYKGDFSTAGQVAENALDTAKEFESAGAEWIHMVDLDGARSGARKNEAEVRAVADRLECIIPEDLWTLPTYQEMLFNK